MVRWLSSRYCCHLVNHPVKSHWRGRIATLRGRPFRTAAARRGGRLCCGRAKRCSWRACGSGAVAGRCRISRPAHLQSVHYPNLNVSAFPITYIQRAVPSPPLTHASIHIAFHGSLLGRTRRTHLTSPPLDHGSHGRTVYTYIDGLKVVAAYGIAIGVWEGEREDPQPYSGYNMDMSDTHLSRVMRRTTSDGGEGTEDTHSS